MSPNDGPSGPHQDLDGATLVAGVIYGFIILTILCWLT